MWVSILCIWLAVSCPTGMRNTQVAMKIFALLCQFRNSSSSASSLNQMLRIITINDCKATGIVATILKPTKAFNQHINNILTRHCTNNSAHYFLAFTDFLVATFFTGRCHCKEICLARDTVNWLGGASFVKVVPAPKVAPRPTRTGATN